RSIDIARHGVAPAFVSGIESSPRVQDAGVVDQNVQPAEAADGFGNELRGRTRFAQVQLDELGFPALLPNFGHNSLTGGSLGAGNHDRIPALGKHLGAGFADSGSRSGN